MGFDQKRYFQKTFFLKGEIFDPKLEKMKIDSKQSPATLKVQKQPF
jgi:hypothetical protein